MKIAFDHQIFTAQNYGGISRYFNILAKEFLNKKNEVKIFAGFHRNSYIDDLSDVVVEGWRIKSYPPKTGRVFGCINNIYSDFRIKKWQPDIVHETYYSDNHKYSKSNVKSVVTAYDMIHELYPKYFVNDRKTTRNKKISFDRVDQIIAISHSTKKDLINIFGIDEKKITVVHLGVDINQFSSVNSKRIVEFPYILYVGNRGGYKNFSGFLKAFSQSNSLKKNFRIIAFGGGCFNKEELELIRELKIGEDNIFQLSGGDKVLQNLYEYAVAFVYPSLYEGFGLPPLEAMSAGCPVISSNSSSMPEVVRNAGRYFDPTSIDEMQSSIEDVVFSEDLRKKLIDSGYLNIKDFSWKKCSDKTLDVYRGLIN